VGVVTRLAFVNFANGRIGEPIKGLVVADRPLSGVGVTFGGGDDDWTTLSVQPGPDPRTWTVEFTPERTGLIEVTVTGNSTAGPSEPRTVTVLAVPAGAEVPSGVSSTRFRFALPANVVVQNLVPTRDNGFWLVARLENATWTLGTEAFANATTMVLVRYNDRGEYQTHARVTGPGGTMGEAGTDEAGNLYVAVGRYQNGQAQQWIDARGVFRSLALGEDFSASNAEPRWWLCRLNADGTWAWTKRYVTRFPVAVKAAGANVYFHHIAHGLQGDFDEGDALNILYGPGQGHVISRHNAATGAAVNAIYAEGGTQTASGGGISVGGLTCEVKLRLTSDGFPVTLVNVGPDAIAAEASHAGIPLPAKDSVAVFHAKDLGAVNWMRLSSDNTQFIVNDVAHDRAGGACWFLGAVYAEGAKLGPVDGEVDVPYSGSGVDHIVLRASPTLGGRPTVVGAPAQSDTAIISAQLLVLQPGRPGIIVDGIGVVPPDRDGTALLPATPSDSDIDYETTSYYNVTGASGYTAFVPAPRAFGGAIAWLTSSVGGGNIEFVPDGEPGAPIPYPTAGRVVIATIDADGAWSGTAIGGEVFPPDDFAFPPIDDTWDLPELNYDDDDDPLPSTPGAPGPRTLPAFPEDSVLAVRMSWLDADAPDEDQSYTPEFAVDPDGPWSDEGVVLPHAFITMDTERRQDHERSVGVVVVPEADWHGTFTFYARTVKNAYPDDLISDVVAITGTVTSVPDPPSAPFPSRMPTVESGVVAQGGFGFVDPDDGPWAVTVAATRDGTYASTVSLPGKGTVAVVDPTPTDREFELRYEPVASGYTGRYSFWVKVTDAGGLASTPTLITGVVSSASVVTELQRVTRTATGATIEALTPLTALIDLDVTEALDGPGSATVTVSASELARRAKTLGVPVGSLVEAGSVEVVVSVNGTPLFCGPVTGYRHDIRTEEVSIYATGLLGYFEARTIGGSEPVTFTGVEQSAIIWDLIEREQAKGYGDLLLTDATVNTSQVVPSIEFEPTDTVASAIYELRDRLNGAEVWIDPDRAVRTATRRGADRRKAIVFTPANTSRFEIATDWRVLANVVSVLGEGVSSTAADAASLARHGRMDRTIDADQLTTEAAVGALAAKYLGGLRELPQALYLTHDANPERPFTLLDYGVGDAVTVEADTQLGRIQMDVRIVSRTVRLVRGTSSSFDVELTVEKVAADGVIRGSHTDHSPELVGQVYDALYRR
jgi:hypothetical protein